VKWRFYRGADSCGDRKARARAPRLYDLLLKGIPRREDANSQKPGVSKDCGSPGGDPAKTARKVLGRANVA